MFTPVCQRVLAYLALHEAASRSEVAGALWPDQPQPRALSELRTALWRLQKVSRALILVSGHVLSMSEDTQVDVRDLGDWTMAAISPPVATVTDRYDLPRGAGLELLPGWDEEWLDAPRTRLRMLQIQAFESIATRLLNAGRVPEALPFVLQVVERDPLRESAQHLLLEIHVRQGNVPEALRQFTSYRTHLRTELGIEPGLRLTTLMGQYTQRRPSRSGTNG